MAGRGISVLRAVVSAHLRVPYHEAAQLLHTRLIGAQRAVALEATQLWPGKPHAEELSLPLELGERCRERRARHQPDTLRLVLHECWQLGRGGARGEQVRLIHNQPVRLEVAKEARREGHVWRRQQHVALAQPLERGRLLLAAVVVDADLEGRRKLAELVRPLPTK